MELDAACKLVSKNMKFAVGASYKDFVHDVLCDKTIKTVVKGVALFKKLMNREINAGKTAVMGEVELEARKEKSRNHTKEKMVADPVYKAKHREDCRAFERNASEKNTPYNKRRNLAKRLARLKHKERKESLDKQKCLLEEGKCIRLPHKEQYNVLVCPLGDKYLLKDGLCHCLAKYCLMKK